MSDIIYTPPASGGGGTTINPTNNFIPVRSNAITFIDSLLFSNTDNLKSVYGGNDQGLFMDFITDDYQFGDINGGTAFLSISINTSSLYGNNNASLESANKQNIINNGIDQYIITGDINGFKGFNLDFANSYYQLGDFGGLLNFNYISVDDHNNYIKVQSQGLVGIGDYDYNAHNTTLIVDDSTNVIKTSNQGNNLGLLLDFPSKIYNIGDWIGLNNSSYLSVDDDNALVLLSTKGTTTFLVDGASDKLTFTTSYLNFVGATLQSGSASGNSGQHLVITLNGTQYKIQLLNP